MGRYLGLSTDELLDLSAYAALHDNALTEYIKDEYESNQLDGGIHETQDVGRHCLLGERNIKKLPFIHPIEGCILYHHECSDGSGPFSKKVEEVPLYARIIHIADKVDAAFALNDMEPGKFQDMLEYLDSQRNKMFDNICVNAFILSMPYDKFDFLKDRRIEQALYLALPGSEQDYSFDDMMQFATLYAKIVDYKSETTSEHSIGMANKCLTMARYYGYDQETQAKLYFAGAVHDIGKLVVNRGILEKPDKLTNKEYEHMKTHAFYTFEILRKIKGLEDVTKWASHHHEKLNGKGYPFGRKKDELGKEERLLACLDIYQALTERRPYKEGMSHKEAMAILNRMVKNGELDETIVAEIDLVFGE